jgi:multiple sugar transport system substrate-binding protein
MKPLIDSPAGQKALEATIEIAKTVPPGTANFGYPECESAFIEGDAPMVIQWSSTGKSAMDPSRSQIMNNVGAALLPGVKVGDNLVRRFTLPTGWTAGIPKYSKNKEMALRALEILSRPEYALKIALNPGTAVDPWRISSFDAPEWEQLWPDNPGYGKQFIEVQKKTVELAVPDLQIPGSDEYLKAADAEISAAITGGKSVEQALADAAAEWNEITERRDPEEQKKAWLIQLNAMKAAGIEYDPSLAQ